MKVLHILPSLDASFGGPATAAVSLVEALQSLGAECTVLGATATGRRPSWIDPTVATLTERQHLLPGGPPMLFSPAMLRRIPSMAADHEIVHLHFARGLNGAGSAALLRRQFPLVVQTHGMARPWTGPKAALDRAIVRPLLRRADRVFALQERERSDLIAAGARSETVYLLPNGFSKSMRRQHTARSGRNVLFAGRLHPRKRPEMFIEMASQILVRRPETRFKLMGADEGSLDSSVRLCRQLGILDKVSFETTADHKDVLDEMVKSDLLVHPACDEPFGMVFLEAAACQLPIVTTHDAAISFTLGSNSAAVVVPPRADALAQAVVDLLGDTQACLRLCAQASLLLDREFSAREVGHRCLGVYNELMEKSV